jgi:uncharacterized phage protein (TIGR02218 family)
MKTLPASVASALASGATTFARCWTVTRRDGVALGFTDHDRALVVAGVTHLPAAGFTASEITASLGLSVDTSDVTGALVSPIITEADIVAGLYDDATVETRLVDWSTPTSHVLLEAGSIGEITREGAYFKAEVRAVTHRLDQERGRVYGVTCDADLGDARCGVNLAAAGRADTGSVAAATSDRSFRVLGVSNVTFGHLARGILTWTSGANAGRKADIRQDGTDGGYRALALWEAPPTPISAGDAFHVVVGCDKRFATCRDRFANAVNFRGFPHVPGNDAVLRVARPGEGWDGTPMVW